MDRIVGIIIVSMFILCLLFMRGKEKLSLSQFPIPNCSACRQCGTIYQERDEIGQTCDCGGFTSYRTQAQPSCYKQTLKGGPDVQMCSEQFRLPVNNNDEYTCLEAAGTFDSGSTFLRNLPCPVPFPPVVPGMKLVAHKQLRNVSELDIYNHLEQGGLIVGANDGNVADYAMKKLIETTSVGGDQGYPNFYYIKGPVLIMNKVGKNYFWMIDYPIKYNPENFSNYVNTSTNWNIAKTIYNAGRKLLNLDAPIFFFSADPSVQFQLRAAAYSCLPNGASQSNTDSYYPTKSCMWGPEYGSGNWLLKV